MGLTWRIQLAAGLRSEERLGGSNRPRYTDCISNDPSEARALGINGVPFFVIDRRYGIPGAQSRELILKALTQARAEAAGSRQ